MGVGPGNEISPSRMSIQAEWEWGLGMRLMQVYSLHVNSGKSATPVAGCCSVSLVSSLIHVCRSMCNWEYV